VGGGGGVGVGGWGWGLGVGWLMAIKLANGDKFLAPPPKRL